MASTSEHMTAGITLGAFTRSANLKKRLLFLMGALIVYRLGSYIPLPGIDPTVMAQFFAENQNGILGMFDMFSGGALGRMTIFALNIMPYVSAAIIMQLVSAAFPTLEKLKKEGEAGRQKLNQYTRYLTVCIALAQGYVIASGLESLTVQARPAVLDPGLYFRVSTALTLCAGTIFLMWLGEQITQRGLGNGISMIIMAGILANLPSAIGGTLELGRTGALSTPFILFLFMMAIAVITFVVFVERSQRRVHVQYPKRQVGNRLFQGDATHLPLKLNTAGVIPPIFASAILLMPLSIAGFSGAGAPDWIGSVTAVLGRGQPVYLGIYVTLVVFFAFFYTSVVFNPVETADNLKRNGGFIPGVRPGKSTADHIDHILTRLTTVGAIYLAAVCVLPELLIARAGVPFYFGGTSLLIVVTVTMDTMAQIQGHMLAHQYEGLMKKAYLKGKPR